MDDYKNMMDMMRPRREFGASEELRRRITSTLDDRTRRRAPYRWIYGVGISCVAAAALLLVFIPSGMSAKEILAETLHAFRSYGSIGMTVEVRTRPMENFRYINLDESFIAHDILIARSDSSLSWRVDKVGRTAAGDNRTIYNWIDELRIGWKTAEGSPDDVLGYLSIFLTPEKILESELHNCIINPEADYQVAKRGDDIILTVQAKPQGDLGNPYMLNTSIADSENIRRYVIDAGDKSLKSASVSIAAGRSETEVLRITKICYGVPVADLTALPAGVRFIDMPHLSLPGLSALTAEEAASAILNAFETWDATILDLAIDENLRDSMYERDLKGALLLSVGSSFTSGNEGTTFVPYVLKLPDGSEKRHNLALQRSRQGGWILVGGL